MSLQRWAAATAAGILLVVCMPVSAIATETDECADAGLISSLLGRCGLLGGLLGGSDPADQDPADQDADAVDTTVPGADTRTDDSDGTSGGPASDTSGSSTGQDDGGATSGTPGGSSADPAASTGSDSPGAPTAGTAGTSDAASGFAGTGPVGPSPVGVSDSGTAGAAGNAQSGESVEPSQIVGPLSELPDPPQVVSQPGEPSEAAGMSRVAESTGPVVGVALTLITAGIFVAITGLWMAIWRHAGRVDA